MRDPVKEHLHFIGIGGTGMCPLAEIALSQGYNVSGSDAKESLNTITLAKAGAKIFIGHEASSVPQSGTVIYSTAIKQDNPEFLAAQKQNLTLWHRSDLLAHFLEGKKAITVAGTSGKTTVSGLIAHMLRSLGLDPTAVFGGRYQGASETALKGQGELFVAEADESDGSFLKYRPYVSVLTNIDQDHLDFFKNIEGIQKAFATYLGNTHQDGCAVIGWDNKLSQKVGSEYVGTRLSFGFRLGCDVRCLGFERHGDGIRFKAMVESDQVEVYIPLLGRHNVENALSALAVARALELPIRKAAETLANFPGVERRMSRIFSSPHIKVYDDYAHNPAKICAAIAAIRDSYPDFYLHVIFQAHRYSRLDTMYNETVEAFKLADEVSLMPVYAAGEEKLKDFSLHKLASDMAQACKNTVKAEEDVTSLPSNLSKRVGRPTVFLTIGAGDVWKIASQLGELLHGGTQSGEYT